MSREMAEYTGPLVIPNDCRLLYRRVAIALLTPQPLASIFLVHGPTDDSTRTYDRGPLRPAWLHRTLPHAEGHSRPRVLSAIPFGARLLT